MTHPFTIVAGGRTVRPPAPTEPADNETEVFTLPQHVIDSLEKQCSATTKPSADRATRQAGQQSDLTKSKKPAS
jgi:hypothetical protein